MSSHQLRTRRSPSDRIADNIRERPALRLGDPDLLFLDRTLLVASNERGPVL